MNKSFDRKLIFLIVVVASLLVVNTWLGYHNMQQMRSGSMAVSHTRDVLIMLESIISLVKDAETGQRGYIITGEPTYLAPYNHAVATIDEHLKALEQLTGDNPFQQALIPTLKSRIASKLKELDETIAVRKEKGFDAAREAVMTDRGKNEMDQLRKQIDEMLNIEMQIRQANLQRSAYTYNVALSSSLIADVFALVMLVAFIYLLRRHLRARDQSEAAIYEQREMFRTTIASIGDAVMTTDTDGRVNYLNAVAQSLTGWTEDAAAGQPLEKVFRIVNEQAHASVESPVARVLREGVIVGLANHTLLISKDGKERPVDDSAAPIRDQSGKVAGVVMVFRDVSERRRVENALREANARLEERVRERTAELTQANAKYQAMYDQGLFAGVMTTDGTLIDANRSSLEACGFTREEVIGKPFWETGWWNRSAKVQAWLKAGFAHALRGRPFHGESAYFVADGSERIVDFAFMPIKDGTGAVSFVVPTGLDITERKHAEEERRAAEALRESEQKLRQQAQELEQQLIASGRLVSLGEVTASMAHEFNNPLGIILGFAQDLLSETDPSSAHYRGLKIIDEETKRCQKIIWELLQFARPSSAEFRPVDIGQIIEKTVNLVANHLYKQKIETVTRIDPNLPKIHADPQQLEQVFVNLYLNAVDAMPEGGKLTVTAKTEPLGGSAPAVLITVADSGFGIDETDLPKIFNPFFSAKKGRGMGLGLSISERIIKNHRGKIGLESQPGTGTTFKIHLPLDRKESQQDLTLRTNKEDETLRHRRRSQGYG
jgi:two-component system cell cycle sensor histidine kinase/response regulator CckA